VTRQHLAAHLARLEGERHPSFSRDRLEAAQAYVREQFQSCGLRVSHHEFSYAGESFVNLIGRPAAFPAGPRLIIGAHIDTVPGTPGADDNASGVAAMLEAARVAALGPWRIPVEFIAFNLEEVGMVGSACYVATLRRERTPVLGMLSLEMVGFTESRGAQRYPWFLRGRYPAVGNYLGLAANRRSRALLEATRDAMRSVEGLPVETLTLPGTGWLFPEARLSDHAPFWDQGHAALMVTDTSFFRNPHYHQPSDTVATLDLDFLTKVTQGLVAAIEALAGGSTAPAGAC